MARRRRRTTTKREKEESETPRYSTDVWTQAELDKYEDDIDEMWDEYVKEWLKREVYDIDTINDFIGYTENRLQNIVKNEHKKYVDTLPKEKHKPINKYGIVMYTKPWFLESSKEVVKEKVEKELTNAVATVTKFSAGRSTLGRRFRYYQLGRADEVTGKVLTKEEASAVAKQLAVLRESPEVAEAESKLSTWLGVQQNMANTWGSKFAKEINLEEIFG